MPARPRLDVLTPIRFFAAIHVVLYHFVGAAGSTLPPRLMMLLPAGPQAVGLFFVLSGFVLAYNYLDDDGRMRVDSPRFWAARLARIYPDYLLAFLIAAPFVIAASVSAFRTVVAAGAYLTMTQAWVPWTVAAWHFPAWSISVETFFYLCFPWLATRVGRLSGWGCAVVIAGCWVLTGLPVWTGMARVFGEPRLEAAFLFGWPPARLPEFVIGMCAARMFLLRRHPSADAGWAALVIGGACLWGELAWTGAWRGVWAPAFGIMFLLLARDAGEVARQIRRRPLIWLGEISYGIYILQAPLYWAMGLTAETMTAGKLGLYVAALVALSAASHYWIGERIRRHVRERWIDAPVPAVSVSR